MICISIVPTKPSSRNWISLSRQNRVILAVSARSYPDIFASLVKLIRPECNCFTQIEGDQKSPNPISQRAGYYDTVSKNSQEIKEVFLKTNNVHGRVTSVIDNFWNGTKAGPLPLEVKPDLTRIESIGAQDEWRRELQKKKNENSLTSPRNKTSQYIVGTEMK